MRSPDDIYDELLVVRCQEGDEGAFVELVQRWQQRLYRYAVRSLRNADLAADAVQESWMAIVSGLGRVDDPARFRPWAYSILTNKCADVLRRKQRLPVELVSEPALESRSDEGSADDLGELRHALRMLPQDTRTILAMVYVDGLSIREVAEALSVPEGTVKSRLYHARQELKQAMLIRKGAGNEGHR